MESCDGHWPVWCSPRHVAVVPVTPDNIDYAQMVAERIRQDPQRRFYVDIDVSDGTLNKKIRQAQQLKYNYVLVLGERETRDQTVAVRQRGSGKISTMQTNAFYTLLCDQYDSFE
jgi:threonyl-tRNA synthetase